MKTLSVNPFLRILILAILFPLLAFAQKQSNIFGYVVGDTPDDKLIYASVVLKKGSELKEGVITNDKGFFNLEGISVGNYTLEIQFLGFQTYSKALLVDGKKRKIDLGTIQLEADATSLDEVVVQAEKSQVALKLDKKVFSVGKDLLSQNGSATDVLDNVPSVSVDPSGSVNLRGNSNVLILINGRRSGLTTMDGLDQIPSDNIKEVEVITNPSARYDASGSAGIINIILKKNTNDNFSGNLRLMTGTPADHRVIAGLNYKKGKINIFSNFGLRYSNYVGLYTKEQRTTEEGEAIFLDQREDQDRHDDGGLIYLGLDYYINDNNSITTAFYRNETKDSDETVLRYDYSRISAVRDSLLITDGASEERRSYNQLELNYTKKFKKEGRKLTFDFQYDFWDSKKDFKIDTKREFPTEEYVAGITTNSDRRSDDIVLQSDYISPAGKSGKIELGTKYENRLVKTAFEANENINGTFQVIPEFTNGLNYKEQILAAYLQYGNKVDKFSYLLGLRTEYTGIKITDALTNQQRTDSTYTRIFPTINLSYKLSDRSTLQLNYSKRINRPNLFQLNPFAELIDFNSRFLGNINLAPSFTDAVELTFLRKSRGFSLNPSVYFSITENSFQNFTYQNSEDVFETTLINLDRELRYGLEIVAQYRPFKSLSLMSEFNYYQFDQEGIYDSQNLDFSDNTWYMNLMSQLKLPKGYSVQSKFNYQGRKNNAQIKTLPIWYLNLAVGKSIFNNNGKLTLAVTNVFNTRKTREETIGNDFFVYEEINPNAARWVLNFSYKFRNGKQRRAKKSNRK